MQGGSALPEGSGRTYVKVGEALRIVKRSRAEFRRIVEKGEIRKVWSNTFWRYHVDDLRAWANKHGEGPRDRIKVEAAALALIREGKRDGDVAQQCGIRLREVERLRLSIGGVPTAQSYAAEELAAEAEAGPAPAKRRNKQRAAGDPEPKEREPSDARGPRDRVLAKLADIRARVRVRAFGKGA